MLPIILKLKLATTAAAGLTAAAIPLPMPAEALAMTIVERATAPVEVKRHDENLESDAPVAIRRDGTMDDATAAEVKHLFRCRQTGRAHVIARRTLAMLADIADKYDRPIEFVSVRSEERRVGKEC